MAGKEYICLFVWLSAVSSVACGDELFVPSVGYETIQSAIESANPGDEIIVAQGLYTENLNFKGKAVTVRSEDPDDPNVVAATIIDGSEPADPNFGSVVVFHSGEGNDSVLTGFTITGGTGSWLVVSWQFKGARWNRCGGGVVCYNLSQPTITKNIFRGNSAGQGGGIYIYGDPVNPADPSDPAVRVCPVISGNRFEDNSAIVEHGFPPPNVDYPANDHGDGGAIVGFQGVDAVIFDNEFHHNHAEFYGGGIHLRQWSHGTIEQNHFHYNDSALGAGIHITYHSAPYVAENLIEQNHAGNLGGGGMYVYYDSHPLIERNRIIHNSSASGSGLAVMMQSTPEIRSNWIDGNQLGSAILCVGSDPWIHHNTILNTSAGGSSNPGGIECVGSRNPVLENNIIAWTEQGYGIYVNDDGVTPVIRYNLLWQNELGSYGSDYPDQTGIAGNLCANPQLIWNSQGQPTLGNYSPCIDAADPDFVASGSETDFSGHPRIMHGRSDLGAFELYPVQNLTSRQGYETIQDALTAADHGDEIVAIRGRYLETINFSGTNVTLRSLEPENWQIVEQTIIDAAEASSSVVTFSGTETGNCILFGFTLTGSATSGNGGGIQGNGTLATIANCQLIDNVASKGAGLYNCDGIIHDCIIEANNASDSGGGLYGCDGIVRSCRIKHNQAENQGGGISTCGADLQGCLIDGNTADQGGGLIHCNGSVINCTIVDNEAVTSGGGLHTCTGDLINLIVWRNSAPEGAGRKDCIEPSYSCLQDDNSGINNITADPIFVDPNQSNYHVRIFSPVIDVGNTNAVPPGLNTDMDLEPRLFTLDPCAPAVVDMGADEVVTSSVDTNGDGSVNWHELWLLGQEWLTSGSALQTDFYPDNFVNLRDYNLLAEHWLWQAGWQHPPGGALQFNSESDGYVWIHTPQGNILNNVYTYTWTAWIYSLNGSQIDNRIIGKNEKAMTIRYSTLVGYTNTNPSAHSVSVVGVIQTGRWHFVAQTFEHLNDRRTHLFVDGQEVDYQVQHQGGTQPFPDWRIEGEWDLMIGSEAWHPGTTIPDAIIDEVAIYNRVLSQQEIAYLYNHGFGRPTPLSLGPIGLWRLDEGADLTVLDETGNGNDGIRMGTTLPVWREGKF